MVSIDDASLGLLAFCLVAWITLPPTFSERLDGIFATNGESEARYREKGAREKTRVWLENATSMYAVGGLFYLVTILIDLAKVSIVQLATFYLPPFIFLFGSFYLTVALYYTRLVIKFMLRPASMPSAMFKGITLNRSNIFLVSLLAIMDGLILFGLGPTLITGKPTRLPDAGGILLTSGILSLASIVVLIGIRQREASTLNAVATLLVFSPIYLVVYVIFGGVL